MASVGERLEAEIQRRQEGGSTRERLESEARRRDPAHGTPSVVETGTQFGRGAGTGIAEVVGAPVDAVTAGLRMFGVPIDRPVGGSEQIRDIMARRGMATTPDDEPTRASEIGRVIGGSSVAGAGVAGAGARAATSAITGATPQAAGGMQGFLQQVGTAATRRPGRFMAAETAVAGGAGAAGFEAQRRFPDTPGAQAIGEILGGLGTAGAISAAGPAARGAAGAAGSVVTGVPGIGSLARRAGQSLREITTIEGGAGRARRRIERATDDPIGALRRGEDADVLEDAPLTAIQRGGDRGMLELENSVMASTRQLSSEHQERFADVNRAIRDAGREVSGQEAATAEDTRQYLQTLLDTRLQTAAQRADERIAELGSRANRETVDRLARVELQRADAAAQRQENQLWDAVPRDQAVSLDRTRERLSSIVAQRDRAADPEDIPRFLSEMIGRRNPETGEMEPGVITDPTVGELQTLRSRVLQARRDEAAKDSPNRSKLSVLDNIQEALLDDMGVLSGDIPELRTALNFSRDRNERFSQGTVGRLLGRERTGEPDVDPGLTLEQTIGRGGPAARVETDNLLRAVERTGDVPAMRQHIESFLSDGFVRSLQQQGQSGAQRYLNQKSDVLNRFPELRREMETALASGQEHDIAARAMTDPNISRAAVFLNAKPGDEVARIINSRRPGETMREVRDLAAQDPEGRAISGLKNAFVNRLMVRSEESARDALDMPFISGTRMGREMDDPKFQQAARELFSDDEMSRLNTIRNTAKSMEDARRAGEAAEGIIGDAPGLAVTLITRVAGVQIGSMLARQTGGGTVQTPAIVSNALRTALERGVRDPGGKLISDAIQDESVMRALMSDASTPRRREFVESRINSWLAGVAPEALEGADIGQEQ